MTAGESTSKITFFMRLISSVRLSFGHHLCLCVFLCPLCLFVTSPHLVSLCLVSVAFSLFGHLPVVTLSPSPLTWFSAPIFSLLLVPFLFILFLLIQLLNPFCYMNLSWLSSWTGYQNLLPEPSTIDCYLNPPPATVNINCIDS